VRSRSFADLHPLEDDVKRRGASVADPVFSLKSPADYLTARWLSVLIFHSLFSKLNSSIHLFIG
jgi:hypothetical protein